jgi:TetR/AcrR family transcriptional regulator, transcriptional repressor for nem operon
MSDSRQRLIDASTRLFLGGSFHKIGIAEICTEADVNKGTFYHFFPSKLELLLEVIDLYASEMFAKLDELAKSDVSPAQKLRGIFLVPQRDNEAWKAEHGSAPGCFLGNVILELGANEPDVRAKAKAALSRWNTAIVPIVEEFFKAEKIYNLDAKDAAEILIGMAQGANVMAKAKNDPKVFRAYAKLAVELIRAVANPR